MWIAFILALALEMIGEAKTVGRTIAYIIIAIFLSLILNTIFALAMPELAITTVEIWTALWHRLLTAFSGFICGKIVRYVGTYELK